LTGDVDTVEWLLNHGADVEARGYRQWAPLHGAVYCGRLQIFQMLIEHHADIHARNEDEATPLHVAASPLFGDDLIRDHLDIMRLLLDHGANPNARDIIGSTPLHDSSWRQKPGYGATQGTVEGTRLLLKYGAIIDAEDNEGRTPLQLALDHRRGDIAACLKEHGATR
jgi:ankyrin repeat protein